MASTLSYSLGADDISKIVDAILPPLSPFLSNLTKNQQYVLLHKNVLEFSKDKTYSNAMSLDSLVKSIVGLLVKSIVDEPFSEITVTPSSTNYCTYQSNFSDCANNNGCTWVVPDLVTKTGGNCQCNYGDSGCQTPN